MGQEEWSQLSDVELVVAALVGNLEAFGELVRRFRPAVRAVVSGMVNSRESAEDVVQDTFLLAFKALPQLQDVNNFPSWLHAIARNRAIRDQQRAKRMGSRSILDAFILRESGAFDHHSADNPASVLEQEESCREVRDSLDELPEEYQVVLRLRYWRNGAYTKVNSCSKSFWKANGRRNTNDRRKRTERHNQNAERYHKNGRAFENDQRFG